MSDMSDVTLQPRVWSATAIDGVFVVAFGEGPDGGWTFEVQSNPGETEQPVAPYCLVLNGGAAHYGGVDEWSVREGAARIALTPSARETLGLGSTLTIELDTIEADEDSVREALSRVLGDSQ